jgi:hypothetical protein
MSIGAPKGFTKKNKESRRTNRYPVEADVSITCDQFQIKLKTVDISAGGLSLKQDLPQELVGKILKVELSYLTSKKEKFVVDATCHIIGHNLNRLEIIEPSNGFQGFLDEIWG